MADTGDHADIAAITEASDLLAWLLSHLDLQEPRIPLDDEARNTIADFCLAVRTGAAPEHMHLFVWDGFNNVAWHALNDDEAPRHGLPLVQFVHLCAVGLAGLLPLGIEGVAEPEPIPFGRLFDMIFHVEPKLREWLRVRRAGKDGYVITTTAKGRERLGQRVRVAVNAMNCLPPDEVFDLAVPYTEAERRSN
ncbi:hypothetical protein [Aureimonas jatrophae]|uniref:Uncharacterized protein n=1 Tax=Aureimonas jatrophae TaxID=1166073 RepID=A0A1H0EIH1_9HYPH|nr:hypothetical protein [Aureimonas jatrophae]MBB3952822.1 hypothetical protein [Aureimonas jatrophae]SDN82086.1 hypothetical protein SAMN05192530_10251 [Aureimonas jatrophae]